MTLSEYEMKIEKCQDSYANGELSYEEYIKITTDILEQYLNPKSFFKKIIEKCKKCIDISKDR